MTKSAPALLCLLASFCLVASTGHASPPPMQLARPEYDKLTDVGYLIVAEAYRRLGIATEQSFTPPERALQMLNNGQADGDVIHVGGLSAHYPNLLQVPVPITRIDAVIFTAGRQLPIRRWADLKPYRSCIRRGIKAIELAVDQAGLARVERVNRYEYIFRMLKAGNCDLAVLPNSVWMEMEIRQFQGLRSLDVSLQSWALYHYLHRSHADLLPALSKTLAAMEKQGEIARMQAPYWQEVETLSRGANGQPAPISAPRPAGGWRGPAGKP